MTDWFMDRFLPAVLAPMILAVLALVILLVLDFAGVIRVEQLHDACCCTACWEDNMKATGCGPLERVET